MAQPYLRRVAPQPLDERHQQCVLHVVVRGDREGNLGSRWIEYFARNKASAIGKQLLQRYGETLRTGRWQKAPLGAHEEGVGENITQPREHPARGRLRVAEARRRSRNTTLVQEQIEYDQQVKIDHPDIGHADNKTIKVRLDRSPESGYVDIQLDGRNSC